MKKYFIFLILFIIVFFNFVNFSYAANDDLPVTILGQSVDNRSVSGFSQLIIAVANWILRITGSLALLAFVVGGVMILVSGGNSTLLERGKKTLVGAFIGLVIVFSSWIIIKYVTESLGGTFNPVI